MDGPIFIGGLERSGKTYMRMLLSGSPRIFLSRRTDLWTRHYNRYGDLNDPENLERCLAGLLKSKHIRRLIQDLPRLKQELAGRPPGYAGLFALIHEQHARSLGRSRWGDQTEFLEGYAREILSAYPDARFIHMLRDPRDRYEAMLHKQLRRGGLGVATARWRSSAGLAVRNLAEFSGRYMVIRYEEMVTDPGAVLQEVCTFLDEEYSPVMLRMEAEKRFSDQNLDDNEEATGPLTTRYIGSFRSGLRGRETAYIQKHSGDLMGQFGYSLEPVRFSWSESLRFHLLDGAINSLLRIGWQMRTGGRA
jgi:hypothetical protein